MHVADHDIQPHDVLIMTFGVLSRDSHTPPFLRPAAPAEGTITTYASVIAKENERDTDYSGLMKRHRRTQSYCACYSNIYFTIKIFKDQAICVPTVVLSQFFN